MSGFRRWLVFLAMCIGQFMAVLDVQEGASALTDGPGRVPAGSAGSQSCNVQLIDAVD